MTIDRERAQAAMTQFLCALGQDKAEANLTATRVTAAFVDELLSGSAVDVGRLIDEGSEQVEADSSDPVIVDGIYTATVCPHHLLVARGNALVAYVPGDRLLGLGTISRLLDACSRRLTFQEEIARTVTAALMEHGRARGAFCRIVLDHACLQSRGALQPVARAITFSGAGSLEDPTLLESVLGRALPEA